MTLLCPLCVLWIGFGMALNPSRSAGHLHSKSVLHPGRHIAVSVKGKAMPANAHLVDSNAESHRTM